MTLLPDFAFERCDVVNSVYVKCVCHFRFFFVVVSFVCFVCFRASFRFFSSYLHYFIFCSSNSQNLYYNLLLFSVLHTHLNRQQIKILYPFHYIRIHASSNIAFAYALHFLAFVHGRTVFFSVSTSMTFLKIKFIYVTLNSM